MTQNVGDSGTWSIKPSPAALTDLLARPAEWGETGLDTRHRERIRSLVNEAHEDARNPEDVRRSAHKPAIAALRAATSSCHRRDINHGE